MRRATFAWQLHQSELAAWCPVFELAQTGRLCWPSFFLAVFFFNHQRQMHGNAAAFLLLLALLYSSITAALYIALQSFQRHHQSASAWDAHGRHLRRPLGLPR